MSTASIVQLPAPAASGGIKLASEAVIIFFVLSGYLVGGSVIKAVRQGTWSWKDYLIKRLTRLWVPLIPCLVLCMLLDHAGLRLFGSASIYHNPPGIDLLPAIDLVHRIGWADLLGNLFFLQGIRAPQFGTDVSLWSLAYEFWYYLAFPCLALAFSRGRSILLRLLSLVAAVAVLSFVGTQIATLFPVWVLGVGVAMLPKQLGSSTARILSVVGLPVLLLCMVEVRLLPLPVLLEEYLIGIVSSAFLYLLVQQHQIAGRSLYRTVAHFLSQISYTLYIVHLPIAIFLASAINSPWHRWPRTLENAARFLALDGVVLAATVLLWRLFEANTDAIRRRLFEGRPRVGVNPGALP